MEVKIPLERRVLGINLAEACISAAEEYGFNGHQFRENGQGYEITFSYPNKAEDILTVKGITHREQKGITIVASDDLKVKAARDLIEGYKKVLATQLQLGWGSNGVIKRNSQRTYS